MNLEAEPDAEEDGEERHELPINEVADGAEDLPVDNCRDMLRMLKRIEPGLSKHIRDDHPQEGEPAEGVDQVDTRTCVHRVSG